MGRAFIRNLSDKVRDFDFRHPQMEQKTRSCLFEESNLYTECHTRPFVEKSLDPTSSLMKDLLQGAISRPLIAVGRDEIEEVFSDPSSLC